MAATDVRPWERQDDESTEAFEAFEVYLHMGVGRTLVKVAEECGKHRSLIERWSHRNSWQNRLRAFDRYTSRIVVDRVVAGKAEMLERQVKQGMNLQVRASARILNMSDEEVRSLPMNEVVALARLGAQMEREARNVSAAEMEQSEREDAPSFKVNFLSEAPEEMISVRLKDGTVGFIPALAREQFVSDHPDAVVIA